MIKRTIEQDGVNIDIVITLTSEEKEVIYREKERKYLKEDIDNLIQQDEDLSEAIDIKTLTIMISKRSLPTFMIVSATTTPTGTSTGIV